MWPFLASGDHNNSQFQEDGTGHTILIRRIEPAQIVAAVGLYGVSMLLHMEAVDMREAEKGRQKAPSVYEVAHPSHPGTTNFCGGML